MAYGDKVLDHYENPRNVGTLDKNDPNVGTGLVGAPACGDVMRLQVKISDDGKIEDARFKTFGCGSAIASSSLVTESAKAKSADEAAERGPPGREGRRLLGHELRDRVLRSAAPQGPVVRGGRSEDLRRSEEPHLSERHHLRLRRYLSAEGLQIREPAGEVRMRV